MTSEPDLDTVKPLAAAKEVLQGFMQLTQEGKAVQRILNGVWSTYTNHFDTRTLTNVYNQAVLEGSMSEEVSRIMSIVVLKSLQTILSGFRSDLATTYKNDPRSADDAKRIEQLETYLQVASGYLDATYKDGAEVKYYSVGSVIETTVNALKGQHSALASAPQMKMQ